MRGDTNRLPSAAAQAIFDGEDFLELLRGFDSEKVVKFGAREEPRVSERESVAKGVRGVLKPSSVDGDFLQISGLLEFLTRS